MGLSGFNRARRSRLEVEKFEAERFEKDNAARWAAHHALDDNDKQAEKDLAKSRKLEDEASALIGEKVVAGIEKADNGGIIDEDLRRDHAAEIAGRTLENNQEPKGAVERLEERIPTGTANEELVPHTQVDQEGPSPELMKAATLENTPESDKESVARQIDADNKAAKDAKDTLDAEIAATQAKADAKAAAEAAPPADQSVGEEVQVPADKAAARDSAKAEEEAKLPAAGSSAGAGTETSGSSAVTAKPTPKAKK
jgi:hypothetical protein